MLVATLRVLPVFLLSSSASQRGQSGDIRVGGSILHYTIEGHGPPCLVVGSSIYYPRTFSKNLRRHLQLIFVDMPWFARTVKPAPLASYNLTSVIEDLDVVRRKLRLDKPILMGHSIHGDIALEYARRHPDHVSKLVMICAPVLMTSARYEASAAEAWKTASPERRKIQDENWRRLPDFKKHPELQPDVENYLAMAPKYWSNPRYDARWIWSGMNIQSALLHHLFDDIFKSYDAFGKTQTVPLPTFAATGLSDFVVPPEAWLEHRRIRNLTVSLFNHSGHTPQLEQARLFDHRLLRWLHRSNRQCKTS